MERVKPTPKMEDRARNSQVTRRGEQNDVVHAS
ncbi:uncharacterized protein G2W53_022456 [Senna tora]|uniref:Uncharacterized protein n=1 Tax=Senna tora TaxID=362788 RepID=A0A834TMP9_9FABA|nr:uncharacterized protein G2W53_022456 [Senna tora]